ncbi:MAG: hypothetical protein WCY37_05030 [Candidatus Dojkabacteria bacterium]
MKNLTGLWPNLSRAYEVAKLGGLTITITYPRHDYVGAEEDYQRIKEYYKDVEFVADGDIWIKIYKPRSYEDTGYEGLNVIHERVKAAMSNQVPERTDSSSEELLKSGIQRLNFSVKSVEIIRKVSAIIAQLEGCDTINAHCMAEAMNYMINFNHEDTLVLAETNTLKFGDYISIKQDGINSMYADEEKNIKKAIEYLKSLLLRRKKGLCS